MADNDNSNNNNNSNKIIPKDGAIRKKKNKTKCDL